MNKKDIDSVIENYQLASGICWPLPIVLQVKEEEAKQLNIGQKISLCLANDESIYAVLDIEDKFSYDLNAFTKGVFGTSDSNHPGVKDILDKPNYFLAGKVTLLKRLPSKNKHFELTPKQTRKIFEHKGWTRVIGFHTRNVAHRAHEYIQKAALERCHSDGIFIHPLTGPKKKGDYNSDIVLKSYEIVLTKSDSCHNVLLAAWQNYPRYAGPREAVFTALCRKNYGCSHFIVGRDHSGVGNFYEKGGAPKLFEKVGNIGIEPVFFNEVHYCQKCQSYVELCEHKEEDILKISGTLGRQMLMDKVFPPDWFMREDLSKFIIEDIREGKEVFYQ
jgi:sulfate adenylyltransferase